MNKKLLAIAVASVMAAPMAAQAAPDLYGVYKMGISSVNDGVGDKGLAVTTDASRLGVKGSENLNDSTAVIYQLETEVFPNDSGAATFGRNTFVGFKAGWGSLRMGKFDTAYKTTTGSMDPFADTAGDMTGNGFLKNYDLREPNMVSYTNAFGGLKLGLDVFMPTTVKSTTTDKMGNAIGLQYDMGSVNIIAASTTLTNGNSATKVGLGLKLGGAKVNLISEADKDSANANIMALNADISIGGSSSIALGYYTNSVSKDNQTAVGYFNKLAKSTKVGVIYTSVKGSSTGRMFNSINGISATPNNPNAIQLFMAHSF